MTVTDKDMGWQALGEAVAELGDSDSFVLVGIQGNEATATHGADEITNVGLGTIHEFGLGVPRRSFIRDAIDAHQDELAEFMGVLGQRVLLGESHPSGPMSETQALGLIGQQAVKLIQQRITAHIPPPLAEITKKIKGSDVPLVRFGTLRKSITYRVGGAT